MKRRHIVAVVVAVLLCAEAVGASAQFRLDFEVALPVFQESISGTWACQEARPSTSTCFSCP